MPLLTFDKVLRIISIILNILVSCLKAFDVSPDNQDDEPEGHA